MGNLSLMKGTLRKMITEYSNPIRYYLSFYDDIIHVNQLIDREIKISFQGYDCLNCHSQQPVYRMGYCKKCFFESPATDEWVIRPELSKAHLGEESRDLEYEKRVQLQPHIVYLAYTGGVKVGVTRKSQIPTRWIDQGAIYAVALGEFPNRYLAGETEVILKEHFSDKTNWRKMLKDTSEDIDLDSIRTLVESLLPKHLQCYLTNHSVVKNLKYPVQEYPTKPISLRLDTISKFSATLKGIKGQYLIFDNNHVFNVRGHEGHIVGIDVC